MKDETRKRIGTYAILGNAVGAPAERAAAGDALQKLATERERNAKLVEALTRIQKMTDAPLTHDISDFAKKVLEDLK